MTITDYHYAPSEIRVKPGEKIEMTLKNNGHEEHGLVFDLPSGEVAVPSHPHPGETERFTVTAPIQPGTYHFHCPVGNHYARGMEGNLIVAN